MKNVVWPRLPYQEFKETAYFLHMATQVVGKLKLNTPYEPHWSNVPFWLTSRGLTTGPISYNEEFFSVDFDFIEHKVIFKDSVGRKEQFDIEPMSVAQFAETFFSTLQKMNIDLSINPVPQEIEKPLNFYEDKVQREYKKELANAWFLILLNTYRIMQRYHSKFAGESPPIGFMWGTFDLRDARYNGRYVKTEGINAGYIRRNAMNEEQVEAGFWPGTTAYPKPAFYSFTYPQPKGIEESKILPHYARWDKNLFEFVLDYDDLLKSKTPDEDLLNFFESCYEVGTKLARWDKELVTSGEPV